MHYVYILESQCAAGRYYVGLTNDLRQRFADHNAGKSVHTSKFRPWILATYIAFASAAKARSFELYLKSGSGRAFAKKHF